MRKAYDTREAAARGRRSRQERSANAARATSRQKPQKASDALVEAMRRDAGDFAAAIHTTEVMILVAAESFGGYEYGIAKMPTASSDPIVRMTDIDVTVTAARIARHATDLLRRLIELRPERAKAISADDVERLADGIRMVAAERASALAKVPTASGTATA